MHLATAAAAAATFLAFIASASADPKKRRKEGRREGVRNFGGQSRVDNERARVVDVVTFVHRGAVRIVEVKSVKGKGTGG